MTDIAVGSSFYGDLRGVVQTLQAEAGRQFVAWMNEANKRLGYTKEQALTINEGRRGKARCELLWGQYVARGYRPPVVASLYHSNHYNGTAADLGGANAAVLTTRELEILHQTCEDFGWFATGLGFSTPELWHFDYLGGAKLIANPGIKFVYPSTTQIKKAETTMSAQAENDAKVAVAMILDREANGGKLIADRTAQIDRVYRNRLGRPVDPSGLAANLRQMFLGRTITYVDAQVQKSGEYKSASNQARLARISGKS